MKIRVATDTIVLMATPEQHTQSDYLELTTEVSAFYDRLQFARHNDDPNAELEAERKMNASLEELGDVLRAMGRTAL